MNYDRKKQEELLYNEKVRQANMQSDAIEMSNMIPLEKDYKYQMSLMKKQLQMILDDNRGSSDLDKITLAVVIFDMKISLINQIVY